MDNLFLFNFQTVTGRYSVVGSHNTVKYILYILSSSIDYITKLKKILQLYKYYRYKI